MHAELVQNETLGASEGTPGQRFTAQRAPILRRHLEVAPAARSFVPVDRRAPLAEFDAIAGQFPVYRIRPRVD